VQAEVFHHPGLFEEALKDQTYAIYYNNAPKGNPPE